MDFVSGSCGVRAIASPHCVFSRCQERSPRCQGNRRDSNSTFSRRGSVDGECVDPPGELACKQVIDHAVALEPGLSFESFRYNIHAIMSLPARPVSGMAFVLVGFVQHLKALRRESFGQLLRDEIGGPHVARLGEGKVQVNGESMVSIVPPCHDQALKASPAKEHNGRS